MVVEDEVVVGHECDELAPRLLESNVAMAVPKIRSFRERHPADPWIAEGANDHFSRVRATVADYQ